nr:molybdate ABC transporter substrate-binding protein [Desulfobacula sp.]
MRFVRIFSILITLCLWQVSGLEAGEKLTLAAGAGYKRLVNELCTIYTAKTGVEVQQIFGNMGQVTAQVKESGAVDFIIGEKQFLDSTSLAFNGEVPIGKGKLIAVTAKGVDIKSLDDLTDPKITRIALPDAKKAIFGKAAAEFFTRKGIEAQLQPKLLIVGTVPQVSAYVMSGEVDIGFVNLTEALAIQDKVGLLLPVDEGLYAPILIVAKGLEQSRNTEAAGSFAEFLQSGEAKAVITQQGL